MQYEGNILKMRSEAGSPIQYSLPLSEHLVPMNELIGREIELTFLHEIHCIKCGRKTRKSFAQGFCFPCFQTAPETEECVLRPELCQAHVGIARDMAFAENHCLIDHFVYLSDTSSLKVGVTRNTQIPTRWIDQGATQAVIIAKTPNRYTAGLIEVALKAHMADRTNWRNMIKGIESGIDLSNERKKAIALLPQEVVEYVQSDEEIMKLEFPVETAPQKIKSANLDKNDVLTGRLTGIKGQYLLFEDGQVINMRKYGGYKIRLNA